MEAARIDINNTKIDLYLEVSKRNDIRDEDRHALKRFTDFKRQQPRVLADGRFVETVYTYYLTSDDTNDIIIVNTLNLPEEFNEIKHKEYFVIGVKAEMFKDSELDRTKIFEFHFKSFTSISELLG